MVCGLLDEDAVKECMQFFLIILVSSISALKAEIHDQCKQTVLTEDRKTDHVVEENLKILRLSDMTDQSF